MVAVFLGMLMVALSYLEKMMETVEILVMNLAFQDLVGTPHQELERKTSVMVDVRIRLVLEYIRIRKSTYVPLYTDTKFVNRIKR